MPDNFLNNNFQSGSNYGHETDFNDAINSWKTHSGMGTNSVLDPLLNKVSDQTKRKIAGLHNQAKGAMAQNRSQTQSEIASQDTLRKQQQDLLKAQTAQSGLKATGIGSTAEQQLLMNDPNAAKSIEAGENVNSTNQALNNQSSQDIAKALIDDPNLQQDLINARNTYIKNNLKKIAAHVKANPTNYSTTAQQEAERFHNMPVETGKFAAETVIPGTAGAGLISMLGRGFVGDYVSKLAPNSSIVQGARYLSDLPNAAFNKIWQSRPNLFNNLGKSWTGRSFMRGNPNTINSILGKNLETWEKIYEKQASLFEKIGGATKEGEEALNGFRQQMNTIKFLKEGNNMAKTGEAIAEELKNFKNTTRFMSRSIPNVAKAIPGIIEKAIGKVAGETVAKTLGTQAIGVVARGLGSTILGSLIPEIAGGIPGLAIGFAITGAIALFHWLNNRHAREDQFTSSDKNNFAAQDKEGGGQDLSQALNSLGVSF